MGRLFLCLNTCYTSLMTVVGVDPSIASMGVAILRDGKVKTKTITTDSRKEPDERLRLIYERLDGELNPVNGATEKTCVVAIEGFALGHVGNSRAITVLGEVAGIVRAIAYRYGFPVVVVANQTWRSVTMGRRLKGAKKATKADRENYLRIVGEVWRPGFGSTDEADAYLIAKTVQKIIKGQVAHTGQTRAIADRLRGLGIPCGEIQPGLAELL